jgi:60 kDa SS-A/Ro ribonucleoprotein
MKMANTQLFQSLKSKFLPATQAVNLAGAPAYAFSPRHQLAQYALTGCLNATFYASAEAQLTTVLQLCEQVDAEFIAQTAIYCRERGYMKDMPALLTAVLAGKGAPQLAATFGRTIDNGKMLRNFVQILRSGAVGRKSLGTRPKKLVQAWLNRASEAQLLAACVGNAPSLADVVKMVHPKPREGWRAAFFAWLIGKPYELDALPAATRAFELAKRQRAAGAAGAVTGSAAGAVAGSMQATVAELPNVPFQMLTALDLTAQDWAKMARDGGWHMLRMNLNTFARHGVYQIPGMVKLIANKLADPAQVAKARVFPYQLLAAYLATTAATTGQAGNEAVPGMIREALQDALECSLDNVPQIAGRVVVCPDVSGSMSSPVSGYRQGADSKVRCIDVAALVAAAMLRKNRDAMVLPFECDVVKLNLNPRDSVLGNAQKLAAIGGGGTNCSAPLAHLNRHKVEADLVIYVSDNESWVDARRSGASQTLREWAQFKARNRQAKLVCIDITPNATTQAAEQADVLNIGGFSDNVFDLIAAFAAGATDAGRLVGEIGAIRLEGLT